ncbi:MAG: site-2 protease family protein [Chlorobium sp.]|nr:site-2 protease family protein [Chlorobium sp.]MCW8819167.1 site-2 protease family protein [Ignavibacteriaceae bacterium]
MREHLPSRQSILAEQNYPLHLGLFALTLVTTLWAGAFWIGHDVRFESISLFLRDLGYGAPYALSLLLFLGTHEFGHFFASLNHRMRATLPYFIPVPPLPFILSLGTLGAVIRIKDRIPNTKALFDTGISGPLSGFVIAAGLLVYGFTHLPPFEYIYSIHPEYEAFGGIPTPPPQNTLFLGKNLLYLLLEKVTAPAYIPPMNEMYHYPFLFAGWLGCFVTALNLLPVGQLDGGHVIYAMFGRKKHRLAALLFLLFIVLLGLPSLVLLLIELFVPGTPVPLPDWAFEWSWGGWVLWAIILTRFLGIDHPPTAMDHELSAGRTFMGWIAIIIFFLCFTPVPFGIT